MASQLEVRFLRHRLKAIHMAAMLSFIVFFCLLFLLDLRSQANTYHAQLVLLGMSVVVLFSYVSLSLTPPERKKYSVQLFGFYALSILTSALVWATGLLYSPFIVLYVIIIIITTQLYGYVHGLLNALLATAGFIISYGLVANHITPYYSVLVDAKIALLSQPEVVTFIYGLLYFILFGFTVLASSSARILLFRARQRSDMHSSYHEHIIQEMPTAVFVTDSDFNILGANPVAEMSFSHNKAKSFIGRHIAHSKTKLAPTVSKHVRSGKKKSVIWKNDTGEKIKANISIRVVPAKKKKDRTYIFFLEERF